LTFKNFAMVSDRIVLCTRPHDHGDILPDFINWHLQLGVHLIIAQDLGSTDGSQDILEEFFCQGQVKWFVAPERNALKNDADASLLQVAREQYNAEWVIMCDADEFLCPVGNNLEAILLEAKSADITVLNIECFNMTGPVPKPGKNAIEALTLRIDHALPETYEQPLSGESSVPYIFVKNPTKTIVRASAFVDYVGRPHGAPSSFGRSETPANLRFLHYPVRGFNQFKRKVENRAEWLRNNSHPNELRSWHWRRWIRLMEEGRLRDEYERQFVSAELSQELVRDGTCTIDQAVFNWTRQNAITPDALLEILRRRARGL
jgi:Glycosyl transferase family 2